MTKVTDMVIWENITRSSFSVDFELLFGGDRQENRVTFTRRQLHYVSKLSAIKFSAPSGAPFAFCMTTIEEITQGLFQG